MFKGISMHLTSKFKTKLFQDLVATLEISTFTRAVTLMLEKDTFHDSAESDASYALDKEINGIDLQVTF